MPRVLVLLPSSTYRARDVLRAAQALDVEVVIGTEQAQVLETQTADTTITLPFGDPEAAACCAARLHARRPLDGVAGLDDETTLAAATIAAKLGLPGNPVEAVAACGSKLRMRKVMAAAGLRGPGFAVVPLQDIESHARVAPYPCVLKPTFLSASRGVIRANDSTEFIEAGRRIGKILADPTLRQRGGTEAELILVEDYLEGDEIAFEGLLIEGHLKTIAIFDKPEPLVGPFFEETLYVTPSRLADSARASVTAEVQAAVEALGLTHGPLHAELRFHDGSPTMLEIAPRPIGGLCPRVVPLTLRISVEELALRASLALPVPTLEQGRSAGVMMIPVPRAGTLRRVEGVDDVLGVPGVTALDIAIGLGQKVTPLPEGNRYLGFVFAAGDTAATVENALLSAHACLVFDID
jgi:biotin carboxylase